MTFRGSGPCAWPCPWASSDPLLTTGKACALSLDPMTVRSPAHQQDPLAVGGSTHQQDPMGEGGPAHSRPLLVSGNLSDLPQCQEKGGVLLLECEGSARSAPGHVGIQALIPQMSSLTAFYEKALPQTRYCSLSPNLPHRPKPLCPPETMLLILCFAVNILYQM